MKYMLATLALSASLGAQEFTPSVDLHPLSSNLTLLTTHHRDGGFVNMLYYHGAGAPLMVDHAGDWRTNTASVELQEAIRQSTARLHARTPARLRYLINTHWHGDHTAGNVPYSDAIIVAHVNTLRRLSTRQTPRWYPDGIGPMDSSGLPDLTFEDSLDIRLPDETVRLLNFGPAHTIGDAAVFFLEADVVHTGDMYHGPRAVSVGEDMVGLEHTLREIHARIGPGTRIATGHGPISNRAELGEYIERLAAAIEYVRDGMETGRSLDQLIESVPEAPWSAAQTTRWLTEIHRSLLEGG